MSRNNFKLERVLKMIPKEFIGALLQVCEERNFNEPQELLTIKEACAKARVSRWTLRRWIQKGYVRALKLGKSKSGGVRIYAASLRQYLGALEILPQEG